MHFEMTQQQARVETKTWPVKPNHSVEMNRRNMELQVVKEKVSSETKLALSRATYANIFLALFLLHACPVNVNFEDHSPEKLWIEEEQYKMKTL